MHIPLKLNHAAIDCRLQGFLTVPQFAISWSDVVCLSTRIVRGLWPPKSHDCLIYTGYSSRKRRPGDVCLQKLKRSYMKPMLKIELYCIVSPTIPILVTVKMLTLLIQFEQTYQPWHKRRSLPSYCPDLAISNILPNHKVNTNNNSQCSEKELFTTSCWQIPRSTNRSTQHHHQANQGNRSLEGDQVWALGALRRLWSKQNLAVERRQETNFLNNKEKDKWMED